MVNRHLCPVSLLFSRLPYKEVQLATAVVIGERNYFGLLFAICTSSLIHFVCPPTFCITSAWYKSRPKRNRRQYIKLCKLLGGKQGVIGSFSNNDDDGSEDVKKAKGLLTIFQFPIIHSVCPPNFA